MPVTRVCSLRSTQLAGGKGQGHGYSSRRQAGRSALQVKVGGPMATTGNAMATMEWFEDKERHWLSQE